MRIAPHTPDTFGGRSRLPVVTTPPADLPAGRTSAFVAGQRRKVIAQLVVRRAAYITIAFGKMVPDSELTQIAAARFEIYRAAGSLVEHAPQAARCRTKHLFITSYYIPSLSKKRDTRMPYTNQPRTSRCSKVRTNRNRARKFCAIQTVRLPHFLCWSFLIRQTGTTDIMPAAYFLNKFRKFL